MPIMTRLLKAHELSNGYRASSKIERAANVKTELLRYMAALSKLELAIDRTEESRTALHAKGELCWIDRLDWHG